jgi:hypothetical protein
VAVPIFGIELGNAHEARERIVALVAQLVRKRGGGELLDGLFGAALLLQQEGVARHAFGGLLLRFQKARVEGEGLGFLARAGQPVKQHAVKDGRLVRPILHGKKVAKRLHRFEMAGGVVEDGLIGLDGLVDAALFDRPLRLLELFGNVLAHAGSKGFPNEIATATWRIDCSIRKKTLYTAAPARAKPNESWLFHSRNSAGLVL